MKRFLLITLLTLVSYASYAVPAKNSFVVAMYELPEFGARHALFADGTCYMMIGTDILTKLAVEFKDKV